MSKPQTRKQLAALSFSEKIKILEKLRDRSRSISANRTKLSPHGASASKPDSQKTNGRGC